MSRTAALRRQHDAALLLVGELDALLDARPGIADRTGALAATMILARLTGLLCIHFAQEDKVLYPELMACGVGATSMIARRFVTEMGTVGPLYQAYAAKWSSADAVLADTAGFRSASAAIFAALGDRIARENAELYVLADELAAGRLAAA